MLALVIDDSTAMRSILARMLRELGFEVLQAGNGQEAITCLQTAGRADLALVDWNMPEMDGLEFVRQVRAQGRPAAIRLVMVTSEVEAGRIALALAEGADEYIMKPFNRQVLEEKLRLLGLLASGA
jgi:two-component system, chemotaxis family, chemotaxis protein CheY